MAGDVAKPAVLIAEGDPALRHLFRVLLRRHYAIEEAPSAALALRTLRATPACLAVLWDLWLAPLAEPPLLDLIEDESAIRRHAFVLVSPALDTVSSAQREQAQRLGIPVLGLPLDLEDVPRQLTLAHEHVFRRRHATS